MEEVSMSYAGCGFLGLYYAGVAVCFKKYASHMRFKHISGASAGAIAACSLLCDMPTTEYINDMLDLVREARSQTLGPFSPSFNLHEAIKIKLRKLLPKDAHIQVSGRIRISLTRVCDGKNVIVTEFDSKEELIDCLLASSFVPIFSGLIPPKFRGVRYIDGMFTDNLPRMTEDTITVSPFCGESDICPRTDSTTVCHLNFSNTSIALTLQNLVNFRTILWPPSSEVIAQFAKQGFEDTLRFLQLKNYINCTSCLSIQSTYDISEEDEVSYDPQCEKCEETRQEAIVEGLPKVVETIFQEYIDSANKGFYNWLLSYRGVKVISLLTLPYTIPIDCAYAFILLVRNTTPHMVGNLRSIYTFLVEELLEILNKVSSKAGYKLSATLRVQGFGEKTGSEKQLKIDFHVDNKNLDPAKLKSGFLSRRGSVVDSQIGDDTYENILRVTAQHDAIMAFYYTDEDNKLRVTEIFDVTDCPEEHLCGVDKFNEDYLHVKDPEEASETSGLNSLHESLLETTEVKSELLDDVGTSQDLPLLKTEYSPPLKDVAAI